MRVLDPVEQAAVTGGASRSNSGFLKLSGQGNLGNVGSANEPNSGTTTESGPKGVLKNDNVNNPNYVLDLPGAKR